MKKVYESSQSTTQHETWDDFEGDIDHIIDPFVDSDGPLHFPEPVRLEKGQEALFKVTVTTTVELVDVRMAETWSKAEVAAVDAKAKELEPLFHADGCGFFYGNKCNCGFEAAPPRDMVEVSAPPHGSAWQCNECGWIHLNADPTKFPMGQQGYLTCPTCKKGSDFTVMPIQTTIAPPKRYEWWCWLCSRVEKINPEVIITDAQIVRQRGSCVVCVNTFSIRGCPLDTMVIREVKR